MVQPYVTDIKHAVKRNENFREVVHTGEHSQLVMMALAPGEEIGMETHAEVDQLLYMVDGEGTAILDGREYDIRKGSVVCVPAGVRHNIVAGMEEPLKLFTVYSPPQHAPGTIQKVRVAEPAAM